MGRSAARATVEARAAAGATIEVRRAAIASTKCSNINFKIMPLHCGLKRRSDEKSATRKGGLARDY